MSKRVILGQAGDTIIEVLIAMSIVAMVLGGAYVSYTRNYNVAQSSKERDLALRVAETQVERIRGYKTQFPKGSIANNSCLDASLANTTNSGSLPPLTTDNLSGGGIYASPCVVNSDSDQYSSSPSGIQYSVNTEVSGNDYTVHVRWLRAGGGQNQETILKYRYY